MGYNIGVRIVEDFLARTTTARCTDMKDTAEKIQSAFKMYLGVNPTITNWSPSNDEFSLIFGKLMKKYMCNLYRKSLFAYVYILKCFVLLFNLIIDQNPMTEFVELPENFLNLKYCNLFCGIVRGACEMVKL